MILKSVLWIFCSITLAKSELDSVIYALKEVHNFNNFTERNIYEGRGSKTLKFYGNSSKENFKILHFKNFDETFDISELETDYPSVNTLVLSNDDMEIVDSICADKIFPRITELRLFAKYNDRGNFGKSWGSYHQRSDNFYEVVHLDFLHSFPNLEKLTINQHDFSTIAYKFDFNPKLESLSLQSNGIETLPNNIFENLNEVKVIALEFNSLNKLDSKLFAKKLKLENVTLFENELSSIPERIFWDNINLRRVDLTENEIIKIPPRLFEKSNNLEEIEMTTNQVKEIPELLFSRNSKLRIVEFSFNKIKFLSKKIFEGLTELEHINFRGNQIKSLDAILRDNRKLKFVEFRDNKIKKISPEIFHKEVEFGECTEWNGCYFDYNPCTKSSQNHDKLENCFENWNKTQSWLKSGELIIAKLKSLQLNFILFQTKKIVRLKNLPDFQLEKYPHFKEENIRGPRQSIAAVISFVDLV